jgi:hypothetical protein
MDKEIADLLIELVEKTGMLRRDMQQKKDIEKYEGRVLRIQQKVSQLAERISRDDPQLAKALRDTWQTPARSLAFRNAGHQKDLKAQRDSSEE